MWRKSKWKRSATSNTKPRDRASTESVRRSDAATKTWEWQPGGIGRLFRVVVLEVGILVNPVDRLATAAQFAAGAGTEGMVTPLTGDEGPVVPVVAALSVISRTAV